MSDRIVTGLRLLRAVMEAQREFDRLNPRVRADPAKWWSAKLKLADTKQALADFETATAEDWKAKQSGAHD